MSANDLNATRVHVAADRVIVVDDGSDGAALIASVPLRLLNAEVPGVTVRSFTTPGLLSQSGVAQIGATAGQSALAGGVLTYAETSGSTTLVRHARAADLSPVRAGDEIAVSRFTADLGVPMAVRGNAVFVVGEGKLLPLTRKASSANVRTEFEFFSLATQLSFVDNRVLVSVIVKDTSVTGAFARVALTEPTFARNSNDLASIAETSSLVSGIDTRRRGGALVALPWTTLFFDRGLSLRVLTANE